MRLILSAAAVLASLALPFAAPAAFAQPHASSSFAGVTTQLPRNVRPTHYDVALVPDAGAARFTARVAIDIDVLTPTDTITLQAANLDFTHASLAARVGAVPAASAVITVDAPTQTATFRFARVVPVGHYRLVLDYSGSIGTQAAGLFSLDYDSAGGRKRALYTQFENSDARRMIPSWDEPAYKASFTLQVTVPPDQMAISNMPIEKKTVLDDQRVLVTFRQTPRMSTYLLFFGLGDFERATRRAEGTELGVVTQKGALSQAQFALDASEAILRDYNDYFGVRYPLPKLDNVAAPGRSQFFGAMENWGAIFTFEYALLLDPTMSTQIDKQRVFAIAAHEMAHQWFGDLVTMQWWDDLWLNEGFASWMESRTTARLHPEWKTAFDAVNVREAAMDRDALATTHPVVQHVQTVEQANQAFDSITYKKGESVIRMMEDYVGADAWRQGVRAYMQAHAYGNTATDDLWRQIEKAAGKPITAIAHDFTLQPGVPMIRVESVDCQAGTSVLTLAQGEFSRDQPRKVALAWRVPVIAQLAAGGGQRSTLVEKGRATLRLPGCGAVLVNAGQTGYYRTVYAPAAFKALAATFPALAPIDQLGLLSDSWSLAQTGLQPVVDFLDLTNAAPLSAEPAVWADIAAAYGSIHRYYRGEPRRQQRFETFAIARLTPVMTQLGWIAAAGEAQTVAPLREKLIATLSELNDPATIAEARRRYAGRASDPAALPGAIRKVILAVVALHADAATWDALRQAAQSEKSPMIKSQLYAMLATPRDEALAQRALALALTDEPGVTNSASMIAGVAHDHPDLAYDFALAHLAQVEQRIDASSRSRYIPSLAGNSADVVMIGKINAYAAAHLAAGSRREAETAVARIKDRVRIVAERLPEIDAWLARQAGEAG